MKTPPYLEDGVVIGNVTDKYGAKNPLYRILMNRFCATVQRFVDITGCTNIHEVGCGEGHLTRLLDRPGRTIRASDFSRNVISQAREVHHKPSGEIQYLVRSIYDLVEDDAAPLIVCCEVLEHLPDPVRAVEILSRMARPYLVVSVPREPLWRALNMARGQYLSQWGNTPGHLNHWSASGFKALLGSRFELVEIAKPLPWTVALCRRHT